MLAYGAAWYLVFLFSTTMHEAAHAWLGLRMGDLTAYRGGQVSLNPQPHIKREPIGMVVVPLISFIMMGGSFMFGWASAPYDPNWANRYPKRAALMSLAGPCSNLLLALGAALLIRIGFAAGVLSPVVSGEYIRFTDVATGAAGAPAVFSALAFLLSVGFALNLLLGIFNLFPFPPLDGSGVLTMFMKHETALRYRMMMSSGFFPIIGLIAAWHILPKIYWPVFLTLRELLYWGT